MRVIAVADEGDDDAGFVGERLIDLGARLDTLWRDELANESLAEVDLVVLLGSDRSVHDEQQASVVAAEQALVVAAERRGIPILAICYGAQLVASGLGAVVGRLERPEIGWTSISTKDEWLCPEGPWFQFHYDGFEAPVGVEIIARTPLCTQAFWHGRTLAVQFHPEVTAGTASQWLTGSGRRLSALGLDATAIAKESADREPAARERCRLLVDRYLDAVARRGALSAN